MTPAERQELERLREWYGKLPIRVEDAVKIGRHIALERADEREACAQVAEYEVNVRAKSERMGAHLHDPDGSLMGKRIAATIRARKP